MDLERLDKYQDGVELLVNKRSKDLVSNLITQVREKVYDFLEVKDRAVEEYKDRLKTGTEISVAAGEFIRQVDMSSLYEPEKDYAHIYQQTERELLDKTMIQHFEEAKKHYPTPELKRLLHRDRTLNQHGSAGSFSEVEFENLKIQSYKQSVRQQDSPNYIYEYIVNFCSEQGKQNDAEAQLACTIPDQDLVIDLQKLLPNGFEYTPGSMVMRSALFRDPIRGEVRLVGAMKNLKDYHGNKDTSESDFFESPSGRKVCYGDLTKPGGILSLFHEISHSWQEVYFEEFGRYSYTEVVVQIESQLKSIQISKEILASGEPLHPYNQQLIEEITSDLREVDVELIGDFNPGLGRELAEDEYIFKVKGYEKTGEFIIKGENLKKLIEGYVRQERDAWAHAIRLLRFFRSKGVNLEPALKSVADFRVVVDGSLKSYQESLQEDIGLNASTKNFTIHGNKVDKLDIR